MHLSNTNFAITFNLKNCSTQKGDLLVMYNQSCLRMQCILLKFLGLFYYVTFPFFNTIPFEANKVLEKQEFFNVAMRQHIFNRHVRT